MSKITDYFQPKHTDAQLEQSSLTAHSNPIPKSAKVSNNTTPSSVPSQTRPKPLKSLSRESSAIKPRDILRDVAATTLQAIEDGQYSCDHTTYDLTRSLQKCISETAFYSPDCFLKRWPDADQGADNDKVHVPSNVSVLEITTLQAMSFLRNQSNDSATPLPKLGILNFASAKHPGGGFINGAVAQEESIARSSTLYPSLLSPSGQKFYALHKSDPKHGYYTHAMIYTPDVCIFRDDDLAAKWHQPIYVDVITSPAVNAGVVLHHTKEEDKLDVEHNIADIMHERMARILYLFEQNGVEQLVLGSFGTGVFRNDVGTVARIWKRLLEGRFAKSFRTIIFAVIGNETFRTFKNILGQLE